MKALVLCLALVLCSSLAAPPPAAAQGKVRIAIWNFDNNSQKSWWFSDQLGPAVRNFIDNAFSEDAKLSDRFSVVEREKLAMVMKEQGLGAAGALDPRTAANVGRILGVRYIVTGAIDSFAMDTTKGALSKFGGIGANVVRAETVLTLRIIDTTTAERIVSVSAEGEVKKGGGFFRGNSLSREAEWGLASEVAEKAARSLVQKFVSGNYLTRIAAASAPGVLEGKIIKVDGERAWINVGTASGVKTGDRFTVFKPGEDLIDPDTGAKLGSTEEKLGAGEVIEAQEKFSVVRLSGLSGKASTGAVVRKASGS